MIRTLLVAAFLCVTAGSAFAAGTCSDQATDKKLAGAAKTSFMKRCEKDATAVCQSTAADKKLNGAAKTSFTNKCVKDSVG